MYIEYYLAKAVVTQAYLCKRTPTYGNMSDKSSVSFVQRKNTLQYVVLSYKNVHIVKNSVQIQLD